MEKLFLVTIFVLSLFLKVSNAAGAEEEAVNAGEKSDVAAIEEKVAAEKGATAEKNTTIQNHIHVESNPSLKNRNARYVEGDPNSDAASVLGTAQSSPSSLSASIIPTIGGTAYTGDWYDHVRNSYTFGLILDVPASDRLSIEVEGTYGQSHATYSNYGHDFNQYSIGGNGKYFLSRNVLQPYIGAGMTALFYENMSFGPTFPNARYSQWMGAAQAIAGLDVEVSRNTAVGVRGQWVVPIVNRPGVIDNGTFAYPRYEDASLMNNTFFRFMGTARLMF